MRLDLLLLACADPEGVREDPPGRDTAPDAPGDTADTWADTAEPLEPAARVVGGGSVTGRLADRDGDGLDDLLVRGPVIRVPVGEETLEAATIGRIETEDVDYWLGTGDLDGDGAPEVLTLESIENLEYLHLYVDASDTTEVGAAPLWSGYAGMPWDPGESEIFVTPDITGDGVDDLEIADRSGGIRLVRPGDPWAEERIVVGDGVYARIEGVGDVDGDGLGDCVSTSWVAVTVYTGAFESGALAATLTADGAARTLGGDFDGDGYGDLAVATWEDGIVQLRGPVRDGELLADAVAVLPGAVGDQFSALTEDLDGDGRDDVLVADPDAAEDRGEVRLTLGLGSGEVEADRVWRGAAGERLGYKLLSVGDGRFVTSADDLYLFDVR